MARNVCGREETLSYLAILNWFIAHESILVSLFGGGDGRRVKGICMRSI